MAVENNQNISLLTSNNPRKRKDGRTLKPGPITGEDGDDNNAYDWT